eukprot:scaffold1748_cov164-Amphora_coffeaeformis.AAC.4
MTKKSSKKGSSTVSASDSSQEQLVKHKRRYCKMEGCERIVKSQGLCQRHGAKPRKCRIPDCPKQAQGNFDGMCKSHFRAAAEADKNEEEASSPGQPKERQGALVSVLERIIPDSVTWTNRTGTPMPLISHLKEGFETSRQVAWHRNDERRIRGLPPVSSISDQFVDWEMELVFAETLALSGTSQMAFRYLAFAWGREEGFHSAIVQALCGKKNSLHNTASLLGSQRGSEATRPYLQVQHVHQPYCPEVSAPRPKAHKIHDSSASACMVTDSDDNSRESRSRPMYYPSRGGMERNEQFASDLFDPATSGPSLSPPRRHVSNHNGRTSSLTFDCEEWNAGSMSRFEERNVDNYNESRPPPPPRCDSPLQLDENLLNEIYQSEGI